MNNVEDILEEGLAKNWGPLLGYIPDNGTDFDRCYPLEELSVFLRIEDVYQGKAKPKVTKEEAIQAVFYWNFILSFNFISSYCYSNGEIKKNHQSK